MSPPPPTAPSPATPVRGRCLCGGVRYEVTGPFLRANFCHCSRCRKHTGAAASTQGRVRLADFRLLAGAELIRTFRPDGDGMAKAFCSACGSSLFGGSWPDGPEVSIRLGTLDDDPAIRPTFHNHVADAPPWLPVPDDGLERYAAARPAPPPPAARRPGPRPS
jgi:hypothetical protein